VLDQSIIKYQNEGWILLSKVDGVAQLKKPKKFSWGWFIFWLLISFIIIGGLALIYVIYYAVKKEEIIVLSTDEQGFLLINGKNPITTSNPYMSTNSANISRVAVSNPQTPEEMERQKKSTRQAFIYLAIIILVIIVVVVIASSSR